MSVKSCIRRAAGSSGIDDVKIQTERVRRLSALTIVLQHSSTSGCWARSLVRISPQRLKTVHIKDWDFSQADTACFKLLL